ncbi:sensor histidine kinase [Streptomyces alkaliterrae]|uniref:histidine kinase n=1 Tax=Streptomyces alkaliterrae TaxID=2213162 RepID=A0A7W3WU87_9ACTN|nr:HAMP domain-containing histidine kinase [Streptomyces alkaliterrae]MBB1258633.1 nitrate- and nitrite sensing domain-containing protein [Streptomyces alkaliterrae]
MGTKRLRNSSQQQDATTGDNRKRARVRNRLLASVVLCAAAVGAAGTPVILAASADLSESHDLVTRAETGKRAISLAHALADERDAQVRAVAARGATRDAVPGQPGVGEGQFPQNPAEGRPAVPGTPAPGTPAPGTPEAGQGGTGTEGDTDEEAAAALADTKGLQAKVDSRLTELRPELPTTTRGLLDRLPDARQRAETADGGQKDARAVHTAYTEAIQALGDIAAETARRTPPRAAESAADGTPAAAHALPFLGRATEQASATRGLLLAALAAGGEQPELTSAAQLARFRELSAAADFEQTAQERVREKLRTTVTGGDVTTAERYLERMTAQGGLSPAAQAFNADRVDATLTARVVHMRSVESSLAGAEVGRLEQLRADDVTALQIRLGLVGAALLLAVGAGVYAARSMTRPLAVVRLGGRRLAADPTGEEPIRFTGRNDEYADVIRSLNELRETAVQLRARAETAEADAVRQAGGRKKLAAERDDLRAEVTALTERLHELDGAVHSTFVQLALRNLNLAERQLAQLEALEERENEPEGLATLFKLDHLATRMRRHGENLLLLAGAEHPTGHHAGPVPLLDVLRAAISEIERYERVEMAALPPHAQVAGFAADDVSHLVAELLENATAFSPPEAEVQLSGWLLENGEVMLSVSDSGIGMTTERLEELNARLGEPDKQDPPAQDGDSAFGIGLYVVAKLAARHGMRVQLRVQKQGGVTAVVTLPRTLLPDRPDPLHPVTTTTGSGTAPALPGTVAEANSHALPGRVRRLTADVVPAAATPDEPSGERSPDTASGHPEPRASEASADPATDPATDPAGEPGGEAAPVDDNTRAADEPAVDDGLAVDDEPAVGDAPAPRRLTDKGLPKRTPNITPVAAPTGAVPAARSGSERAEELRRRIGGFTHGAREGERAAAEAGHPAPADDHGPVADDHGAVAVGDAPHKPGANEIGDTPEEARQ